MSNRGPRTRRRDKPNYNMEVVSGEKKYNCFKTIDGIPVRTIYIGSLPEEVTKVDLIEIFFGCGEIIKIDIVHAIDGDKKRPPFAFCTFRHPWEASRVLHQRKNYRLGSRKLYLSLADSWHQPIELENGKLSFRRRTSESNCEKETLDETEITEEIMDEQECPIMKLNDDCLHLIFDYIPFNEKYKLNLVCRRWRNVVSEVWSRIKRLDFTEHPLNEILLTQSVLKRYLAICPNLTSINLCQEGHSLPPSVIADIASKCNKNLEELSFNDLNLRNRVLSLLARYCPNLKVFEMEGCSQYNDRDLVSFLNKVTQLRKMALRYSLSSTGQWMKSLKPPLESLVFQFCSFSPEYLIQGLENAKETLKEVVLESCVSLRGQDLEEIVKTLPGLTSLTLGGSFPDFKSDTLHHIACLKNLTELNLEKNNVVSNSFLEKIVEGCRGIKVLNLSGEPHRLDCDSSLLTSDGLCLVAKLPELTDLSLNFHLKLNDSTLKKIAQQATKLKSFCLIGCPYITDDGVASIISLCNVLELLDLTGCTLVTNDIFRIARETGPMGRTKKLTIIVGGSGVKMGKDLETDFVVVTHNPSYVSFIPDIDESIFILEDLVQEDRFGRFHDDVLFDLEYLDYFGLFDEDFDIFSSSDTDSDFY